MIVVRLGTEPFCTWVLKHGQSEDVGGRELSVLLVDLLIRTGYIGDSPRSSVMGSGPLGFDNLSRF